MFRVFFLTLTLFLLSIVCFAQSGVIKGKVTNSENNEPVGLAYVTIQGEAKGAQTDFDGYYEISDLEPGTYNLEVSALGFKGVTEYDVEVTNARPAIIDFSLITEAEELEEVVVTSGFVKKKESPVSLRTIGVNEIKRNPGGNRDISRVVRSLPGVGSSVSFRNDILIRGGAPGENTFYLDGIEVPNINHFATQGASGGPVGLLNVDLIQEVDFYSGAFPANRGGALSSVFEFDQKTGRTDNWALNGVVGASDLAVAAEGPTGEKSSLIFSVRRSYLQFLFSVLGLPFLPTYNDAQFKYELNPNKKTRITVLGLGAIDDFELNEDAADDPSDEDYRENKYTIDNIPISDQWNYTIGTKVERFRDDGRYTFVLSRNMLRNQAYKYEDNDESKEKTFDYLSDEIENKFRFEDTRYDVMGAKINYGFNLEQAKYTNSTFQQSYSQVFDSLLLIDFSSELNIFKYGLFGQITRDFFDDKLSLSFGFRVDANDYSDDMNNPLDQFSPRFSASYQLTDRMALNFNTGRYYQLPAYTILGYEQNGQLVNKQNNVKYIRNDHLVGGVSYEIKERNLRFSVESFYKKYSQYPFSVRKGISLANLGADFGVIGNEPVTSTAEGRAYGAEFLAQQKFYKGFYGILAYTYVRSEFTGRTESYVPSAWDARHLVSLTGGKKFGKSWEAGFRWLFSGGTPFTPYDVETSMMIDVWEAQRQGVPDYSRLNERRIGSFHQLDIRIDKKFFFDKWTLNLFLDIQNVYNYTVELQDILTVQENENGQPLVNEDNPNKYVPAYIPNTSGTILPTLGIIVEL